MPEDSDATRPQTTPADGAADPVAPAQDPQAPAAPVPAPGPDDSSAGPGAWTPLAAPGKPDGEVDTRS